MDKTTQHKNATLSGSRIHAPPQKKFQIGILVNCSNNKIQYLQFLYLNSYRHFDHIPNFIFFSLDKHICKCCPKLSKIINSFNYAIMGSWDVHTTLKFVIICPGVWHIKNPRWSLSQLSNRNRKQMKYEYFNLF